MLSQVLNNFFGHNNKGALLRLAREANQRKVFSFLILEPVRTEAKQTESMVVSTMAITHFIRF